MILGNFLMVSVSLLGATGRWGGGGPKCVSQRGRRESKRKESAARVPSEASLGVLCEHSVPTCSPVLRSRGSGRQPRDAGVLGVGGTRPQPTGLACGAVSCGSRGWLARPATLLSHPRPVSPPSPQVSGPSPARGQTALKSSRARTS